MHGRYVRKQMHVPGRSVGPIILGEHVCDRIGASLKKHYTVMNRAVVSSLFDLVLTAHHGDCVHRVSMQFI